MQGTAQGRKSIRGGEARGDCLNSNARISDFTWLAIGIHRRFQREGRREETGVSPESGLFREHIREGERQTQNGSI